VVVDGEIHGLEGGLTDPRPGGRIAALDDVVLLNPCTPRMIVCAGANYASQLAELGLPRPTQPVLFLKGLNTLTGPDDPIRYPDGLERLEYEGELAVVIGRTASNVKPSRALDHVAGYTCANDVTASDFRADGQWTRAKSADTFCPMGPWIETDIVAPQSLRITTRLNGRTVQDCGTDDMVFGVSELIGWISRWITLQPGDVILTASPAGVGPMTVGDTVEVDITGIGSLSNTVGTDVPAVL
jgi:2-keto-4-pentenoate hydratase/2-oxohepta-3-ene-1,7-dioic acid hydratase in catechol pathway